MKHKAMIAGAALLASMGFAGAEEWQSQTVPAKCRHLPAKMTSADVAELAKYHTTAESAQKTWAMLNAVALRGCERDRPLYKRANFFEGFRPVNGVQWIKFYADTFGYRTMDEYMHVTFRGRYVMDHVKWFDKQEAEEKTKATVTKDLLAKLK